MRLGKIESPDDTRCPLLWQVAGTAVVVEAGTHPGGVQPVPVTPLAGGKVVSPPFGISPKCVRVSRGQSLGTTRHLNATPTDSIDRTDTELTCPVPGCDYSNPSANGIVAHVGHHPNGWDDATREPWEIHADASDRDESDRSRSRRVHTWLRSEYPDAGSLAVYVHQGYDSVQIRPVDWLEDWDGFLTLVREADGLHWNGDVAYCSEEFVEELPAADGRER